MEIDYIMFKINFMSTVDERGTECMVINSLELRYYTNGMVTHFFILPLFNQASQLRTNSYFQ